MLDPRFIRTHPDLVRQGLADKGEGEAALEEFLRLDAQHRALLGEVESLKAERNTASKEIGGVMAKASSREEGERQVAEVRERMRGVSDAIQERDRRVADVDAALEDTALRIPNLPHESVPRGRSDADNVVVRTWREPWAFDFTPKPHWEVGEALDILDFPRATKITGVGGVGFALFKGAGARLQRALMGMMLDIHTHEHGFREVWPPTLASRDAMIGSAQIPKMEEDMYRLEKDDLFLVPTAEVPLTNLHREEILEAEQLPLYYTAYTPCFRREAGAAGRETRGLIRTHEFDKVEMVKFVRPETSYDELETLTRAAEVVLRRLGLPYRVMALCTGDMSFASAKTYDLEVWAPGVEKWLEVSSCSNFEAFQARRANVRYRPERGAKPEFVHILNGSGLAFSRVNVALLETYQKEDGSVEIPKTLQPYMGGMDRLAPE